jgi:DNA-binding NtrC family response regulator
MGAHVVPASSFDPRAPRTALVVEPTLANQILALSALSLGGFQVTVADNYRAVRAFLDQYPPTLLLTEIRLKEYNGLHLVLRGKTCHPSMATIVTTTWSDAALQSDAESLGATFVPQPVTQEELLAAVMRTLHRGGEDLDGQIRPPFERRMMERRAILDPAFTPNRRVGGRRRDDHPIRMEMAAVVV